MCNGIHDNARLLSDAEREGVGYKIFRSGGDGQLYPMTTFTSARFYVGGLKDNKWNDKYAGDGFCFFFELEEAIRLMIAWMYAVKTPCMIVLHRIEYKEGLCEQDEDKIVEDGIFKIGLCRYFEIKEKILTKSNFN